MGRALDAFYDGFMWNGHPVAGSITSEGAQLNSVTTFSSGVVGRGVLLDVARHLKVDCLYDYTAITPETLDAVAEAEGVTIGVGDVVLVSDRPCWLRSSVRATATPWRVSPTPHRGFPSNVLIGS